MSDFDFEAGNWPDGMRITYNMTKWLFLDCYYSYCCHKFNPKNREQECCWAHEEHEIYYAYEQSEGTFRTPIELLMLEVIALILNAGRNEAFDIMCRNKISNILKDRDFALMLKDLPQSEKNDFEHDLKRLGLMS